MSSQWAGGTRSHRHKLRAEKRATIDQIDCRILNALQENNQHSNVELADLVGVSPPTCLRRVRRLRKEKIILSDISLVDTTKIDCHYDIIVLISLREEVHSSMSLMEKRFREIPEISQCYLVTGEFDYALVVKVKSMNDYNTFTEKFLYSNNTIKRFSTLNSLKMVKFSISTPITLSAP